MKIIENTLEPQMERWEDPGDYPSAAGSFPLPSYDYVEGIAGHVKFELEPGEEDTDLTDLFKEAELDLPSGVTVSKWTFQRDGMVATAEVEDFDASGYEPPEWEPPEPDYD